MPSPNGAVAQSVEQKTENLCVGGSIPSHTTNRKQKALTLKLFRAFLLVYQYHLMGNQLFPCPSRICSKVSILLCNFSQNVHEQSNPEQLIFHIRIIAIADKLFSLFFFGCGLKRYVSYSLFKTTQVVGRAELVLKGMITK